MEQGLGVRLNFACMSLSVPLSPSKNTQKNVFSHRFFLFFFPQVWSKTRTSILSVFGQASKPPSRIISTQTLPKPASLRSSRTRFVLPCSSFVFPLSTFPPSISLVLPWMVFFKWQSRRSLPNPVAPWKRLVRLRSTYFPKGPNWTPFSNEVWSLPSSIVTRPVLYLSQWRYPQWWRECSFFWDNN